VPVTTTLRGVRVPGRGKRRGGDAFDLVLTPDALVVERHGEAPRRLPWEQITEWELEQRQGDVCLTLRGGGAVTPLVVPRWRAEDLDAALQEAVAPVVAVAPMAAPDPKDPTT
jgi:hypothetical protein